MGASSAVTSPSHAKTGAAVVVGGGAVVEVVVDVVVEVEVDVVVCGVAVVVGADVVDGVGMVVVGWVGLDEQAAATIAIAATNVMARVIIAGSSKVTVCPPISAARAVTAIGDTPHLLRPYAPRAVV